MEKQQKIIVSGIIETEKGGALGQKTNDQENRTGQI